ncbi:hypothetical protein [Microbacterium maritypicum]|uniref:hypothetical protein n=1 Tax=Microbacterium maritypicum TaxID=33918 RepID=UPI003821B34C
MADQQNAQDLVRFLRGRGVTTAEIAVELRRSPRMVRKILNGETSGALYRDTLEELASTGRVTRVPPRRRLKDGSLMPVRTKAGAESKTVIPEDPGGRYTEDRQGGRMQISTTYMAEGGRQIDAKIPKGRTAKGRAQANVDLVQMIRNAAKGQAKDKQKQITARVTFANGRQMEVNTYNASTMLKRVNEAGGDTLGWLARESELRYVNLDVSEVPITGVTLNVTQRPKTGAYDRNQSRGRSRLPRTLTPVERKLKEEREAAAAKRAPRRREGRGASS